MSGAQQDLFATSKARRDDGMARAEAHADDEWKDLAWETLVAYLSTHEEFFVDDLWSQTDLPTPREARALGPVILRAVRKGFIVRTGRSRPSVRSNLSDKPVWRSTICRAAS